MRKKVIIIGLACITVLAAAIVAVFTLGADRNGDAVASVNGTPISQKRFEESRLLTQAFVEYNGGEMPDDQEILATLLRQEVLLQEAARRGITIPDEEIQALLATVDEAIAQGDESAQATLAFLTLYAQKLGMSYEEYRAEKEIDMQRSAMMIEELYLQLQQEHVNAGLIGADYAQELYEQAEIEIYL